MSSAPMQVIPIGESTHLSRSREELIESRTPDVVTEPIILLPLPFSPCPVYFRPIIRDVTSLMPTTRHQLPNLTLVVTTAVFV